MGDKSPHKQLKKKKNDVKKPIILSEPVPQPEQIKKVKKST